MILLDTKTKLSFEVSMGDNFGPISTTLSFTDKPEGTTLITSVKGNAAVQGDSVTFTCRVTGANPAVSAGADPE